MNPIDSILRTLKLGSIGIQNTINRKLGQNSISKKLAIELLNLRGIPAKFAQIKALSQTEENLLWREALWEADPMPTEAFLKMISDINPSLLSKFKIDHNQKPYVASIGQVQKATLDNGNAVAIKVQFPDLADQLNQDLNLMGLAGHLFEYFKEGFYIEEYSKMIRSNLVEELDYLKEARSQQRCADYFQEFNIIIPRVHEELSASSILCTEWIESIPLDDFIQKCSADEKINLAYDYMRFYLYSIFELGLIHTDPNPSNFGVHCKQGRYHLVVFDFGSTFEISEEERRLLWLLIFHHDHKDIEPIYILEKLGFNGEFLFPINHKITAYLSIIFDPLLSKIPYDFKNWKRKERIFDLMGPERMQFMLAAPAKIFPLIRAFQGLLQGISTFDLPIYFVPTLEKLKHEIERDASWLDFFDQLRNRKRISSNLASYLKIEVYKDNKQTVSLSFPRSCVEQLEQLIDDDLMQTIQKQGISIHGIIQKVRENGYKPMTLFKMEHGEKVVHVYLDG